MTATFARRCLTATAAALFASSGLLIVSSAPAQADVDCVRTNAGGACTELREVNRYGSGQYAIVCVTSYYEASPNAWEIAWVDCW